MPKIYAVCLRCGAGPKPDHRRKHEGRTRPFCGACYKAMAEGDSSWCPLCNTLKKHEHFSKNKRRRNGLQTRCKPCLALEVQMRRYGLTGERRAEILKEQGGACALCTAVLDTPGRPACVDHDHETGVIRGLLCRQCNVALGKLGDSEEGLERALAYLRRSAP